MLYARRTFGSRCAARSTHRRRNGSRGRLGMRGRSPRSSARPVSSNTAIVIWRSDAALAISRSSSRRRVRRIEDLLRGDRGRLGEDDPVRPISKQHQSVVPDAVTVDAVGHLAANRQPYLDLVDLAGCSMTDASPSPADGRPVDFGLVDLRPEACRPCHVHFRCGGQVGADGAGVRVLGDLGAPAADDHILECLPDAHGSFLLTWFSLVVSRSTCALSARRISAARLRSPSRASRSSCSRMTAGTSA